MFSELSGPTRQLFWGNLLLVGCCVFYLLWWAVAFKPTGAIKGMKSGWLLIPAFILGIAAVVSIIRGSSAVEAGHSFFSGGSVLLVAVIAYVVLLVVTRVALHRQVTTELLLIVGWAALTCLEGNALYGMDILTRNGAMVLFVAAILAAAVSMVCYVLYYGLTDTAGYVDGMIPLLLVAIFMVVLAILIARSAG